uniref:Peroxisomal membrane protein MPV17 n=1 Tax=Rhodosorus marinus TaxID=101924 RepID=A0A7S2ZQR1_9RHOD|mmetsp:Transcript_28889/g.112523  ORF Transcript_28889/g.112523 Transcript_28889/m.112523 type:complete len:152 (+) Transcript_28889:314-769(+)
MVDAHSHVFVFFAESSSSGPAGHAWYGLLDRVFKPSASLGGLIKSVSVDQLGFAPIILGTFFTYLCVLEGKGAEATRLKLSQDLPPTVVNNWFLWVPTQIINFKYVPEFLRLPVVSSVALLWNIYLAVMTSKPVKPREADNRFKHDSLETA